jgi:transcriptional regulator with XRE-family HTH domain
MQRAWVGSKEYRTAIETLRALRERKGVSQRELARRLKKPPSFINKIELLERRLDIVEFMLISAALDEDAPHVLTTLQSAIWGNRKPA